MSKSTSKSLAVVTALIAAISAVVFAQQPSPPKPAEPTYTEVKYSADKSSYKWVGDDRILVLTGKVKFTQGDMTLVADRVDYRESTKTANATGNLKISDNQTATTATSCTVNFEEKKGALVGNVRITARPKPKPQTTSGAVKKTIRDEWKDEVTVTCEKADYYYKLKKAVVPGAVTIVQKTRTVTADSATYFGSDEKVELVGNVKGRDDKDKHTFAGEKVTVSLKDTDQWIEVEKASGSFFVKEDTEEQPPPGEKSPEKPAEGASEKPEQ